jgi:hypothetical protein
MAKKKAAKPKADPKPEAKEAKKAKSRPAKEAEGEVKTAKKAAKKSRSRKKPAAETRLKIFWGVFNHASKRVALYDFNQRKAAEKKAKELSEGGKPPHFVQKVKEAVVEPPAE